MVRLLRHPSIRLYLELSKSGIVTLVLVTAALGYLLGQDLQEEFSFLRLTWLLVFLAALSAGSSALNQIQDVQMDSKMPRTAKRPLPSGKIHPKAAWIYVILMLLFGTLGLFYWVSHTVALLGIGAVLSYNGLYTLWWKPRWRFAAVPGAIPGALPALMGHVAASNELFHPGGIYLFAILFFWQMPHFWSLAIRYREDYAKGEVPTLPVSLGDRKTLAHINLWGLPYVGLSLLGPLFLPVGGVYLIIALIIGAKVLWELFRFHTHFEEPKAWLRFFLWVNFSLIFYLGAAVADYWSIFLWIPWIKYVQ